MSKQVVWDGPTIVRVARFHSSQGDCTRFTRGLFGDDTWRIHFAYDEKRSRPKSSMRKRANERTEIEKFLIREASRMP
jgi:hypothetical protein